MIWNSLLWCLNKELVPQENSKQINDNKTSSLKRWSFQNIFTVPYPIIYNPGRTLNYWKTNKRMQFKRSVYPKFYENISYLYLQIFLYDCLLGSTRYPQSSIVKIHNSNFRVKIHSCILMRYSYILIYCSSICYLWPLFEHW